MYKNANEAKNYYHNREKVSFLVLRDSGSVLFALQYSIVKIVVMYDKAKSYSHNYEMVFILILRNSGAIVFSLRYDNPGYTKIGSWHKH